MCVPVGVSQYAEGIYSISPESEIASQTHLALLVDYPVLLRAIRATDPDAVPRLGDMLRHARTIGAVFVSRAYGAWYDLDEATTAFSEGFDPVYVPPAAPGNVPTTSALVADGLALLKSGQIQALALSGDDRLLPLVAAAHVAGAPVVLIAHACQPDGPCIKLARLAEPAAAFARAMTRPERYRRATPAA
ncbi:MAG: NYN domain-containing protein [Chloroflexota bacterium]|nr:NYN domain-containing protein [Chloroflexota bacterium]